MIFPRRYVTALASALLVASSTFAQDKVADPLALIPPKAVVVVQVNGIERVQERLNALIKNAAPDKADEAAKFIRDALADALGGRDLKALRPDGRVLVAFSDLQKLPDDITVSFLFPATNADEFRKKFLTEDERKTLKKEGDLESVQWEDRPGVYYLIDLAGYVAVCSDKGTATDYAKGKIAGIAKQISPETARTFLDSDVAVFVNVKEVNARYGEQLKKYKSVVELFLKGDTIAGLGRSQLDQLRGLVGAVFRVLEDGTAAVLAVDLQPEGARLKAIAQFGEKTPTSATLSKAKPVALLQLGALPSGQASYAASALGNVAPETAELLTGSFAASDTEPAAKDAIVERIRELAGLEKGTILSAGSVLAAGGLEVIESKDPEKIVAGRLAILKSLSKTGAFASVPLKDKPDVIENAERVGSFSFHSAHLNFDLEKAVADLPAESKESTKASIKRSVGEEQRLWFGTDGKQVVQVIAKDWAEAKRLISPYLLGVLPLSADESFQSVRKRLPAEANMLVVLDASRSAAALLGAIKDTAAPAAAGKPAYIGIALVLKPNHAAIDVFVPAAAIEQVRKMLIPLLERK